MSEKFKVRAYAVTGAGKTRLCNQDSYCVNGTIRKGLGPETEVYSEELFAEEYICAVFDGMGGEKSGDVASYLCSRALQEYIKSKNCDIDAFINHANSLVCNLSKEICARCGTTMALVRINGGFADIYNIGDSRIYHFSDGRLNMLSVDHTAAQSLINIGVLTKEEARNDSRRHTLTRTLGVPEEEMLPEAHISRVAVKQGDKFILCTDGITEGLDDLEIWEILTSGKIDTPIAQQFYDSALSKSGKDNLTVTVAEIL